MVNVSVGVTWLLVPVRGESSLLGTSPDLELLKDLSTEVNAVGIYAFSGSGTFVARAFAPAIGVEEDPVTGTGAACLAAYANSYLGMESVEVRQGHAFNRIGTVKAWIEEGRVWIGGEAITTVGGELLAASP